MRDLKRPTAMTRRTTKTVGITGINFNRIFSPGAQMMERISSIIIPTMTTRMTKNGARNKTPTPMRYSSMIPLFRNSMGFYSLETPFRVILGPIKVFI